MFMCRMHSFRGRIAALSLALLVPGLSACASTTGGAGESGASAPPAAPSPADARAACKEHASMEEVVTVHNDRGALEGTLVLPAGCGPHPVAFIVPGSGPTDRDGNQPSIGARPYLLMAEALSASGIGTLRYDKASVGASRSAAPSEADLRFPMGATDAALFVRALRADPRVGKVTLVGHSEGSLVGMLAAAQAPVDAFVSVAGAGRRAGVVLREQLTKNLTDAALLAEARAILDALERGELVPTVPSQLSGLFRPSVQPYMISWLKLDPAAELARVATPNALVVQGTTDIQIGLADAERLAAARPDARLLLIDGMNHVLKHVPADTAAQRDAYANPSLPLDPALVTALVGVAR